MGPVFRGIEGRAIRDLEITNGPLSFAIGVTTSGDCLYGFGSGKVDPGLPCREKCCWLEIIGTLSILSYDRVCESSTPCHQFHQQ